MNNIIKNTIKCNNNIQVLTDNGFVPLEYIHKTIKFKKYLILFESGREIECADSHCFILYNGKEKITKNLKEGDILKSVDGFDIIFDVFNTGEYKEMYDITLKNYHLYYTNGILSHNSNVMTNFASRQVLHGHNVVMLSLEMSQDMNAQRMDSIYSLMDINRMYFDLNQRVLIDRLTELKRNNLDRGELIIKHFPTGAASVRDFRVYLRELIIRGLDIDIIYVDYINLMKSAYKEYNNLYSSVKSVAEELRALSFEFETPVVSVSQLNREGSFVGFAELDFNYIAESMGLPATADFMTIMGIDQDRLIYENELHYKIVKNRLGGRVSEIDKFYYDKKTLKMYDALEQDLWVEDATVSRDTRQIAPPPEEQVEGRRGRR